MRRIAQDLLLIILPFAGLSIFFFLGEQPKYGIAFIVVALAAAWYVRPRGAEAPPPEEPGATEA